MKKISVFVFVLMGCASLINAKKFKIDVNNISVNGKTNTIDSVHVGDVVVLSITFQNYGAYPVVNGSYQPDSFSGGKYLFNNNVSATVNESKVDFTHILTLPGIAFKGYTTIQDTITISDKFYIPGTNNIVIVWPSGGIPIGGSDTIDTAVTNNNYTFYVFPHEAGINSLVPSNQFNFYPNPAKDVVNIEMKESGNGSIRLMDMAGKTLVTKPYSSKAGENISLPLNEGSPIPDGLYLIGIQTTSGYQVEKVMICR